MNWCSSVREQSEWGQPQDSLTQPLSKWVHESSAAEARNWKSWKCETNGGCLIFLSTVLGKSNITCNWIRAALPSLFFVFLPWLTHLFLAHTLPGPHHHLDTRPMPPKYHRSSAAEREMEENVLFFLSNTRSKCSHHLDRCSLCFICNTTNQKCAQMQLLFILHPCGFMCLYTKWEHYWSVNSQ